MTRYPTTNLAEGQSPATTQPTGKEEWLTLKETAQRAGLHVETLRRYMRQGLIPYNQPRKHCAVRIPWKDFQAALKRLQMVIVLFSIW